jgi:hypothetical protein
MRKRILITCALVCAVSMEAKKDKRRDYAEFRPDDRTIIYDYYRQPSRLPPGLAKKNGQLPPGQAKKLQRNGRLPPGLEKKLQPFPVELDRRLPPLPAGCRRGLYEDQAVIYDTRSMAILDVVVVIR